MNQSAPVLDAAPDAERDAEGDIVMGDDDGGKAVQAASQGESPLPPEHNSPLLRGRDASPPPQRSTPTNDDDSDSSSTDEGRARNDVDEGGKQTFNRVAPPPNQAITNNSTVLSATRRNSVVSLHWCTERHCDQLTAFLSSSFSRTLLTLVRSTIVVVVHRPFLSILE